jgi:hypothetical protein
MIRVFAFLAALFALAPTQANAQASVILYCLTTQPPPNQYQPCSSTWPLQVSSSGGGGGAITAAINSYAVGALQDGADATEGTKGDAAYAGSGSATVVSILKGIYAALVALGSPFQAGGSIGNTSFGATLPTTPTVAAGNGVVPSPASESAAGLIPIPSTALEANHVIKGSAGNLYSFNVSADSMLSGAAWWLMIYNATSAPSDGAVTPIKCYAFPSGTTGYSAAFTLPINLSAGITLGVSTTGCFTKTASAHAFISGDAK